MNPSSSASKATHNQKSSNSRRKKQHQQQKEQSFRNPLQDLNNGGGITSTSIDNTSNASSFSSIEAPKGCLRFFLSHSSSSNATAAKNKTPFNNNSHRPIKGQSLSSKTPKSAPNMMMRPTRENSSRNNLFNKPISQKGEKVKMNHHPCLYQRQSGKKSSSFRNVSAANCKVSSFLEPSRSFVNNELKSGSGELRQVVTSGVCESDAANWTPLCKVASGSGFNSGVGGKVVNDNYEKSTGKDDTNSTSSNAKTPPVQASVSPEIQCGSSMMLAASKTITPTCYGAGHVVSGITDKRKCRPRGMLTVGEAKALGSLDTDDDNKEENDLDFVSDSTASIFHLPMGASMHWLLSPCSEEDEERKENSHHELCRFQRLEECALRSPPASPDLCNNSANRSIPTVSSGRRGRRSAALLSPSKLPEFQRFMGPPMCDDFSVALLEEEMKNIHDHDGENSPFSVGSLGSGNVIQTPQSDSSTDRGVGVSCLNEDVNRKKHCFNYELNSVAEHLQMSSLSPKSHVSIWDPSNSSFRFDSLNTPSTSVDLSKFHKILDDPASWFSNSTLEDVSQSHMRISWREGLMSRMFEMDEFDCCRCLSDEEDDANVCNNNRFKSLDSPELNVDAVTDHSSINGFGSAEFLFKEQRIDDKTKGGLPSDSKPTSCAESISTDGGGLISSEDSDWTLCYKNQLFQV